MADYKDMSPQEKSARRLEIINFCYEIEKAWTANPDWRFGQLVSNSFNVDASTDSGLNPGEDAWLYHARDEKFNFKEFQK